jgi:hypothetical protein
MKNTRHFALCTLAAAALAASCQCPKTTPASQPETWLQQASKLPNGLAVDLVSGPCGDSAALVVLIDGGIHHDPAGKSGMALIAGRVLSAAPRTIETGSDYMLYSVVASGDQLLAELDTVAAWMKSAPTESDLARAKARVLEELAKASVVDGALAATSLAEESVLPTPGHGRRLGIGPEVETITLFDLQPFWQERFKPGNAHLIVAGRFDPAKVRARIDAAFAPLPAGTAPVPREPTGGSVRGTLVMSKEPTALALAIPAPALDAPLYPSFLVLASRLLEAPAAPRAWQVRFDPLRRPELLLVTAPVAPGEPAEPTVDKIRTEIGAILSKPFAPGDLARAKEKFRLLLDPRPDPAACTEDARAFAIARARRAQLKLEGTALAQALDATTKDQLEQASRHFGPEQTAAVVAGGPSGEPRPKP